MFGFFSSSRPFTSLEPGAVAQRLDDVLLVDVREPDEFRAGHIPGAVNVPLSRFEADVANLPRNRPVVLYCLGGNRSQRALAVCARLGVPFDTHMAGGITAWRRQGLKVT